MRSGPVESIVNDAQLITVGKNRIIIMNGQSKAIFIATVFCKEIGFCPYT